MSVKYGLITNWSAEDQSFVVEIPALPGYMADRTTYEKAEANTKEAIEEWIETSDKGSGMTINLT